MSQQMTEDEPTVPTKAKIEPKKNIENEIARLEALELDGALNLEQYAVLLGCYLTAADMKNAQFLWKRFPADRKKEKEAGELLAVWSVGQHLWLKEINKAYDVMKKREWSDALKPIIQELASRTRTRMIHLVSKAYSSILLENLAALIDGTPEETLSTVRGLGWSLDENSKMVLPLKEIVARKSLVENNDKNVLGKSVSFVSFLEN